MKNITNRVLGNREAGAFHSAHTCAHTPVPTDQAEETRIAPGRQSPGHRLLLLGQHVSKGGPETTSVRIGGKLGYNAYSQARPQTQRTYLKV